jgi:uncharacterized repeat protein (TIGR01451 family)
MQSFNRQLRRAGLAFVAVGSIVGSEMALAEGTASGVTINNTATVNYSVSGVAQAAIGSSPTGNSSGAGSPTLFVVDNKVNLTVTRVGVAQTPVASGQTGRTVAFRLENIGNTSQGYRFLSANLGGDGFDMNVPMTVRVSADTVCSLGSTTPPALGYQSGTDTADFVQTLAADSCRWVYIIADAPGALTNGDLANVTLTAVTVVAGAANSGVTVDVAQTVGADTAGVDVVFADALPTRDGRELAQGTYVVATAALSVQKTSSIISDPFLGTAGPGVFPKAIPGAVMEYAVQLTNTGGADAGVVSITDAVPANTAFAAGQYNAGASDVSITVGAGAPTFCVAESTGTDGNGDGCFRTALNGTLNVGAPAVTSVAQGGVATRVTVRFRVTIN